MLTAMAGIGALFTSKHLKSMLFLVGMYGIWNLWAGTNGFFFPYILRTVGSQTQAASVAMQLPLWPGAAAPPWYPNTAGLSAVPLMPIAGPAPTLVT